MQKSTVGGEGAAPPDAVRARVLLASPLPPPIGGISQWTAAVLASPLAEHFALRVFDTAPREDGGVSGRSRFRGDRALAALRMLWALANDLRRDRPQVLHINTSYHWAMLRDGAFVWIARALGVRTILHFRGGDFPEFAAACPRWAARLLDATLRRTDRLVAITAHTESFLASRVDRERIRSLPNFVDPDLWSASRVDPEGPVEILYVGWVIEAKGIRELLTAMQGLPEARLTLVGPVEPAFAAGIGDALAALGDRVRVLPARARSDLVPLYAEAEIFAFPTWREGFPNVVLEAMAAGLPLVTTPVGAIPEIVREGEDALLVPPRDPEALAAALRELVEDEARRRAMGASARERALVFSRDRVRARLAEIWQELADSRPR